MEYKVQNDYAIKSNIIKYSDIFDFEEMPYEILYSRMYKFCRDNLDNCRDKNSIPESLIFFSNNRSINAAAGIKDNHGVILINIGLMMHCFKKYLNNVELNDYVQKKWPEIVQSFDSEVSHLAFQINTQFTYYHELAHIIQQSKFKNNTGLHERGGDSEYSLINHQLELNADTYSAISIATHLHQYIINSFDEITQPIVENTITFFGACLLEYIASFNDNFEMYYDKYLHPHPYIRMLNIILNITNHFSSIPTYTDEGITLDNMTLFRQITDFHKELEGEGIFTSGFAVFISNGSIDIKKTISHLEKIRSLDDNKEYTDAMQVWNGDIDPVG